MDFKSLILLVFIGVFYPLEIRAEGPELGVKISVRFPKNRQERISQDLAHLFIMPAWNPFSEKEKRIFGFDRPEHDQIFQWLDRRIGYLIPETEGTTHPLSFGEKTYQYPNFNIFPEEVHSLYLFTNQDSEILMSNYGVSYYYYGKKNSRILRADLSAHFPSQLKPISIVTPRIGIISLHDNFFKSHLYVSKTGRSDADKILRLSFLFHEARHSDGNGKTLGFFHVKCPAGTEYAGKLACDKSVNGSYTIGSLFLKKSIEVCLSCTDEEKDVLRTHFFDSQSRVLDKKILTPTEVEKINELENKLDETARSLFQAIEGNELEKSQYEKEIQMILEEINRIKNPELEEIYWDPTPEVIGLGQSSEMVPLPR